MAAEEFIALPNDHHIDELLLPQTRGAVVGDLLKRFDDGPRRTGWRPAHPSNAPQEALKFWVLGFWGFGFRV